MRLIVPHFLHPQQLQLNMSQPVTPTPTVTSSPAMPPPPPPPAPATANVTSSSDEFNRIDLNESYRDVGAIENVKAIGASYADFASAVLERWKEVSSNMHKIENMLVANLENRGFRSREYETVYNHLVQQEKALSKQLQVLYPARNPHIDQVVALIETQWHLPPSELRPIHPGQLIFSRYNYCPPKTPLQKYSTSFPTQP
ncbi:hypothetical protein BGX20_002563 [Mortierella sp. AD010]|nr:hypothetical protein BGX20_002563 [Mortierella sp. AD010]